MVDSIIGFIIIFLFFFFQFNFVERKRKEEERLLNKRKKEREEEKKREAEAEQNRLEELKYENLIVVFASFDNNDKPTAILKRSDNKYTSVERADVSFVIAEKIKIKKEIINKWNWYDETEYKKQLLLQEKREFDRQKNIKEQNRKADFLKSFGIEYLYHMTHKNNLENIIKNGLLSHNQARNSRLIQVDIADNQVNDRRSKNEPIYGKSIHDYVPLYFNPKNPMLYKRGNIQNDIIIIAIDKNILYQPNVVFTNGNAAASATSFFSTPNDLARLNWACINAEYWNDIVDGKRIKCSEVLVYPSIPLKSIKKIFCNNKQTKQFIENIFKNDNKINVEIKTNLYFGNFSQQINIHHDNPRSINNGLIDDLPF